MDMHAETTSPIVLEFPREVIKKTITDHQVADQNIENRENSPTVLEEEHEENPSDDIIVQEKRKVEVHSKGGNTKICIQAEAYKSEELKKMAIDESKSNIIRLETVEKHEETQVRTLKKIELSDEELSRRIQLLRNKSGMHWKKIEGKQTTTKYKQKPLPQPKEELSKF
ncbi:hypothetical protein ACLB2K_067108 [Fragaria x ananassa]